MKNLFNSKILSLSQKLGSPLYAVGGCVRDFILEKKLSLDIDLASACHFDRVEEIANSIGLFVVARYKRTGTLVLFDGERKYEFTSFRKDFYSSGGAHAPSKVVFTDSILEDALRRDFKCNAVYYDITNGRLVDPLGGVEDIKNSIISTVKDANEVFSHDGLRLMRLARFCSELNFTPSKQTLIGATQNKENIVDISKERIFSELIKILYSDKRHSFSDKFGHYNGLKILQKIGVLPLILPEVCSGDGVLQRADYHKYDVLEHTLSCVKYADEKVRLSALFHDVAKPYCLERDGNFYMHAKVGAKKTKDILKRFAVSNKLIDETSKLVEYHMLDFNAMKESKLRLFIVENYQILDKLLLLKEADFRALKDQPVPIDLNLRVKNLITQMKSDKTPFSIKELNLSAIDLMQLGFNGKQIGYALKRLMRECVINPKFNDRQKLTVLALNMLKNCKNI